MTLGAVAIVGSGVAGTTVANALLDGAKAERVVMFEAGPVAPMRVWRSWLDHVTTGVTPYDGNEDIPTEIDGDPKAFLVPGARLMAVGGSTLHWGGWCPRFKPEDFRLQSNTGKALDWPFDYAALAPYYDRAEQQLRVAGDGQRNDPPRFGSAFPVSPPPFAQKDGPILDALADLGLENYGALPIARNGDCQTTGTCKYCPVGGRYDATMDLPMDAPRFTLRDRAPVIAIEMRTPAAAAGLRYLDGRTGESAFEAFDHIFICAGAIESAKLLLASQNAHWPEGLGNRTGHVGRHLVAHSLIAATGAIRANPDAMEQELDFPTLECRAFDTPEHQGEGKFYFVRDDRGSRVDLAKGLAEGRSPAEMAAQLVGPMRLSLSGFIEEFASAENRLTLGSGRNRFGLPRTRIAYRTPDGTQAAKRKWVAKLDEILLAAGVERSSLQPTFRNPRADHAVATCRMSLAPADGVVDGDCRVHDCDNVTICSNAVFPNISAVNPTLTLTALTLKVMDGF